MKRAFRLLPFLMTFLIGYTAFAQEIKWDKKGDTYYSVVKNEIFRHSLPNTTGEKIISTAQLSPKGQEPLSVTDFAFSADGQKVLVFTNTK
ncbi:MAG: S9 family peptidase, partial [Bacteroidetes bacterium]|nr:S9 family peptidase [Bacteroidota bacterium]